MNLSQLAVTVLGAASARGASIAGKFALQGGYVTVADDDLAGLSTLVDGLRSLGCVTNLVMAKPWGTDGLHVISQAARARFGRLDAMVLAVPAATSASSMAELLRRYTTRGRPPRRIVLVAPPEWEATDNEHIVQRVHNSVRSGVDLRLLSPRAGFASYEQLAAAVAFQSSDTSGRIDVQVVP